MKNFKHIRIIHKVTLSSPCLWASFYPLSPLSVVSTKYLIKSQYGTLQLGMKCSNSARGSRLITVVILQLGPVKIYVAALGAFRKKERQDETQFTTKIDGFLSFIPH
jgi:hypothetical protein